MVQPLMKTSGLTKMSIRINLADAFYNIHIKQNIINQFLFTSKNLKYINYPRLFYILLAASPLASRGFAPRDGKKSVETFHKDYKKKKKKMQPVAEQNKK